MLPAKLAALEKLLPGVDIPRLVRNAPQLLEYDVEGSLQPKLQALRKLFHPTAAGVPAPSLNAANRLATNKLLKARRSTNLRGPRSRSQRDLARSRIEGGGRARNGGAAARSPRAVGMLRLAALDIAVVEQRLSKLSQLLPEADVVTMVSKQPGLLRRDTEATLRPRLRYLAVELGDPSLATSTICANPRLLLSSWGVLARLRFVREEVTALCWCWCWCWWR